MISDGAESPVPTKKTSTGFTPIRWGRARKNHKVLGQFGAGCPSLKRFAKLLPICSWAFERRSTELSMLNTSMPRLVQVIDPA